MLINDREWCVALNYQDLVRPVRVGPDRRFRLKQRAHATKWRVIALVLLIVGVHVRAAAQSPSGDRRPRIGVALGGGSARGLAHVGVIRWFEEHRIPIDLVAGTSMGGLIGGAFASGMSSAELTHLLETTDWDEMFGSSPFRYKNVRRKQDARVFPTRLEFGLRRGIVPPVSLNSGQQVDLLLARIAGAYLELGSFDELPTPFRCLAVDLVRGQPVVLDHGSLADAMRATMSLPGIFPPIELDGRVLVDGGAMNNVPADVVRAMGADVVVAVNVGYMGDERTVNYSMLGLMGQTVDVMMQANTRVAMKTADVVINPSLTGFGSLDWRRSEALAAEGYRAAEAMRDTLLPLAVDESAWAAYQAHRQERRRSEVATPQFLSIVGVVRSDERRMQERLQSHVGQPLDVEALETELETFAGLDRYETVGWQLVHRDGQHGLQIRARQKRNAPPFFMLGVSLENTTTDEFAFQLAGRYLAFDVGGSGSELRVDAALGAQPRIGAEWYRPLGRTPLFFAASARAGRRTLSFIQDDTIVAQYEERRTGMGLDGGINLGRDHEVRVGATVGRLDASIGAGDPRLPELDGRETRAQLRWLHDGQDSPVVPSSGVRAVATVSHVFESPEVPPTFVTDRSNDRLTQAAFSSSVFWSVRRRDRAFLVADAGTSFGGHPLPTEQFQLGTPLRLGAFDVGEFRGDHYAVVTAGYLRGVGRLPDFLGGPIYVGAWLENGSAFDDIDAARLRSNTGLGAIVDTLIGPMVLGSSFGFDGDWRYYVGIGRVF
jgi:NTE family protein